MIDWYIARNMEQNMTSKEKLIGTWNESINKVYSEIWRKTCKHVEDIEKDYLKHVDLDFQIIRVIDLQDFDDGSETIG